VERLLGHWDGYTANHNNYRLYHDPSSDSFVFIPDGMDQLFQDPNYSIMPQAVLSGRFSRSGVDRDGIDLGLGRGGPERDGLGRGLGWRGFGRGGFGRGSIVANSVFEIPNLQRKYVARTGELLEKVFTADLLAAEVTRIEERVRKQLLASDAVIATNLLRQAGAFRSRLQARVAAVRAQYDAIGK
jgi:hypothetical protein